MLGGAVAFYFIHLDSFESLENKLLSETGKLKQVELLLEQEFNSSEANMTALLKINREYRKELEKLEESSEGARDELSFIEPKIKKLNEKLKTAETESSQKEEEINKIKSQVSEEREKIPPLTAQRDAVLENLNEVTQSFSTVEENWRRLDQNFSSLNRLRAAVRQTYIDSTQSLMEEIVRPFEIFYGDSTEVEIENISHKENGFFTKLGMEEGIRSGFVFIVKSDEEWSEVPIYLTCSLVEKDYSFLKTINSYESSIPSSFRVGKKLTLIRTAELTNSFDSSNLDDKKSLSQTDF